MQAANDRKRSSRTREVVKGDAQNDRRRSAT